MKKEIIVKVQVSLFSSNNIKSVLIYDETKHYQHQGEATQEVMKAMNGDEKKFFYATIKNKNFVLGEEAPWQDW